MVLYAYTATLLVILLMRILSQSDITAPEAQRALQAQITQLLDSNKALAGRLLHLEDTYGGSSDWAAVYRYIRHMTTQQHCWY